ncbi:MAG: ABC transporter ATPase [Collinsella sp.]|nr:ABC transporter ATPase [Collinsella sp.]
MTMTKWTITTILCDLVLAVVINTSAMLLTGAEITPVSWYPGTASAFFTNVLLQLVLPVPGIAAGLTGWIPRGTARLAASVFVENLIFVTCISLTMAYLGTGGPGLIEAWIATYPALIAIGYVTSIVLVTATAPAAPAPDEL